MDEPPKAKRDPTIPESEWRDPQSGCFCVICLAPVRESVFVARGGTCPRCEWDDPCVYG